MKRRIRIGAIAFMLSLSVQLFFRWFSGVDFADMVVRSTHNALTLGFHIFLGIMAAVAVQIPTLKL